MFLEKEFDKERILAVIDSLIDGLLVFDINAKVLLVNQAIRKFFGLEEKEILGKSIVDFSDFSGIKYLFYLLGKGIREVYKKELKIKDDLILEVTSTPILIDGQKIGTIVILHDITREKAVERMKTEFVTIAAHQLRTPLSEIKWVFNALLREKSLELNETQKEIIKQGYHSIERFTSLINDLLKSVEVEEGRYVYKFEPLDIEETIQKALDSFEEKIKEKELQFEFKISSKKLPKIKADKERITIVFENLIDNAIRYTPKGGMIVLNLQLREKEIEFSIKDSGIGIPEREQKDVYKKFFRASNALKTETEGSGLGLYIAKNIIEAHKGKIYFTSKEGEGTTFYFTLPLN